MEFLVVEISRFREPKINSRYDTLAEARERVRYNTRAKNDAYPIGHGWLVCVLREGESLLDALSREEFGPFLPPLEVTA